MIFFMSFFTIFNFGILVFYIANMSRAIHKDGREVFLERYTRAHIFLFSLKSQTIFCETFFCKRRRKNKYTLFHPI